jgi:hypothetical protein
MLTDGVIGEVVATRIASLSNGVNVVVNVT